MRTTIQAPASVSPRAPSSTALSLDHLSMVLSMISGLGPDDRAQGIDDARAFSRMSRGLSGWSARLA